jgi:hypothetical protein
MARRPPAFVRNQCEARLLNIGHGLYPREPFPEATLAALVAWLRQNVRVEAGRTYAGGLTKFEPKEVERILIPRLEQLNGFTGSMDKPAAKRRRGSGESPVSHTTA